MVVFTFGALQLALNQKQNPDQLIVQARLDIAIKWEAITDLGREGVGGNILYWYHFSWLAFRSELFVFYRMLNDTV